MNCLIIIESQGDWIDGLIVGFDMLYNKIGKLLVLSELGNKKYNKRIFVITDGETEVKEADQLDQIVEHLNGSDTSVNVISIDFCSSLEDEEDSDYKGNGDKKEDKKSEGKSEDGEGDDKMDGGKISHL